MNKQEAIDKLEHLKCLLEEGIKDNYNYGFINALNYALNIVKQLDEPEKLDKPERPVVPQFVADWLEVCKENLGFSLSSAMSHSTSVMKAQPNEVQGFFNLKDNQETFAKAWLFGYEVKKEKLYTVEIPNLNSDGYTKVYLGRNKDNTVGLCIWGCCSSIEFVNNWKQLDSAQLTESEIKKDYSWAWQFAKGISEDE